MKIGIVYPQPEMQGDAAAISKIALMVEEKGFDHLLVYDHVLGADLTGRDRGILLPYGDKHAFTDPLTMFAYLAGLTNRINLMSGVLILPQRQTPLVARQAADVDLLSDGRLILGVGIGSNHIECEAMGADFSTRGARCSEQIELLRKLWSGELISFDGRFEKMDRVRLIPPPKREIPIWIGGYASRAIERVGRLANGFIAGGELDVCIQQREMIDTIRAKHNRMDEDFGYTFQTLTSTSEDQTVTMAEQWREAGGTHVSISTMNMGFGASVDAHLEFIERVADRLGVTPC
jgi:probable F420-dependent oxidoreductase